MNLSSIVSSNLLPAGAVMPFANNAVPTGWLAANGAELSKTTYATLFATIGTTYGETNGAGGAGTTHFRAPDLRGVFVRGFDGGRGLDPSRTFGSYQGDGVIAHTHSGTTGGHSQDHTHGYASGAVWPETSYGNVPAGGSNAISRGLLARTTSGASVNHSHDITLWAMSPAGATETRPKNIAMLYCIKF